MQGESQVVIHHLSLKKKNLSQNKDSLELEYTGH